MAGRLRYAFNTADVAVTLECLGWDRFISDYMNDPTVDPINGS